MKSKQILKSLYSLLDWKQKITFLFIMLIMVLSSILTQLTPKAIGWLTDDILSQAELDFPAIFPILFFILIVNIVNEIIKILRRILVEDIATKTEKKARGLVISSLLKAPLAYFKENMTGNIHGRLNRCLEGTVKLEKLVFMDFAPAIFNSIAAIVVIFTTLPANPAFLMLLVIPVGIAIVFRQIHTQKGIRVELLESKAHMDGAIVELLNGIEVIRITDSNSLEEKRFTDKSEYLRSREMRHHLQMAKYDCLKFINEVFFTVLMIGTSAYLAARGRISVGGGNLSGGQKQRIAIARIFLRKPEILILDEATSALDNTSERFIQNEIEQLKKENSMTVISIAHRLTTLKNCDNIIVMDHGKVVQSGKYPDLINKEGIFSDMYYGKLK